MIALSMQLNGELKKEQIDTLFVCVALLPGRFWGGWVGQGGPTQFLDGCSTTFFFFNLPALVNKNNITAEHG
jgi:hypothetical protein